MSSHATNLAVAPSSMMNATQIAAAAALKKQMTARALAHYHNKRATQYFGIAMAGFIILFSIVYWTRLIYSRYVPKSVKESSLMRGQVTAARLARQVLNRPAPGFKSIGHLIVVLVYLGINIVLVTTNMDYSTIMGPAKRCGWMAFSNIAFLTFLALKNTPLAFLTAHSYETLNPLHQVVGYTTIVTAFTHVIIECYYFTSEQESAVFLMRGQKFGMLAASSLFVILISTFIIKKMRYEVFYVVHISMYILVIVALTQHRPDFSSKEIFILILAGSLWSADRILRAGRLLWNSYGNEATIHPLPCGGTRLVIRRPLARAIPGTHCFLWLPKIRKFETHPFTLVSTSPNLELVINAYDGFTSDLHDFAVKNPGMSLKASVDGPYGAIPDFSKTADKVILIAGGSGASFTFGVAVDMIERLPESSKTKIDFIWTVREEETVNWFAKELALLQCSPRVSLFLHTTRPSPRNTPGATTPRSQTSPPLPSSDLEKATSHIIPSLFSSPSVEKKDVFTSHASYITKTSFRQPWATPPNLDVAPGRPDIDALIMSVVRHSANSERILIGACGPESLMWAVRRSAANAIGIGGPSVELHSEQFGW